MVEGSKNLRILGSKNLKVKVQNIRYPGNIPLQVIKNDQIDRNDITNSVNPDVYVVFFKWDTCVNNYFPLKQLFKNFKGR